MTDQTSDAAPVADFRGALFPEATAQLDAAHDLIGGDVRPGTVELTWLGKRTAFLAWTDADGQPHTRWVEDDEADTIRAAGA